MKFTKRLLTIALSMGMVMPLCATAYAAPTVTDLSATIKANAEDTSLYDVTVTFTVADSSKQVTLLLTGPNTDNKLDDNDIVHINQFGKNEPDEASIIGSGTCTFSVSKERMTAAGATVDESAGTTTLSVSMGADDADAAVSVQATYDDSTSTTVPVTGVTLDPTTLGLVVGGDTATLVATVAPTNATNKNVTWSSSNTDVAKVDANGKVTAVAKGSATIRAFVDANENGAFDDGEVKAECTVTVTEAPAFSKGDATGDDTVNILDCDAVFEHIMERTLITDPIRFSAADVTGDGAINILDFDAIFDHVMGKGNLD